MNPASLPKVQGKPLAPILGALMKVKPEKDLPKTSKKKNA